MAKIFVYYIATQIITDEIPLIKNAKSSILFAAI